MLVYANRFVFEPENGPAQIIQLTAKWVGQRASGYVDAGRLSEGIRELHLKDGSTLSSRVTLNEDKSAAYPYLFCARLSHGDDKVSGRRWVTEIGLRQEASHLPVECSILLKTDEVSARVTSPIQVTRPKLIQQLVDTCHPVGQTPGLAVKRLDAESAAAFLHEVEHKDRHYPLVLISSDSSGHTPVTPERLRSVLVGLADVVNIPSAVDTYELQETVGRRFIAFGGAINIIFPMRQGEREAFCETVLLRPSDIKNIQDSGLTIESEVLAAITHRANLPYSWRHISTEAVSQAILRGQLARMIDRAKSSDDLTEYVALLQEADKELRSKDDESIKLREAIEAREIEVRKLQADISGLKHSLSGRQSGSDAVDSNLESALTPLREAIISVLNEEPSLEQSLELIAALFPERLVVLDAAFDSAKESDRGGFRYGNKAFELLSKLAVDYWKALSDGKGDQQAKSVFGQNGYAANESSVLSNDGRRRRTFSYRGRDFLMEKHLKHGVKDSVAETLRIHFEWIANEKKIVVGHCGKHLDF